MDGACWVFLLPAFTVKDMNVRIFWVCGMEYMCIQTRLPLHSHLQEFWGMESEPMLTPRENPLYQRLIGGSNPQHWVTLDGAQHTTDWAIPAWFLSVIFGPELLWSCPDSRIHSWSQGVVIARRLSPTSSWKPWLSLLVGWLLNVPATG